MKNQGGHLRNLSNTYTHPTTYTDTIHSACIHAHHMHHTTIDTHIYTHTLHVLHTTFQKVCFVNQSRVSQTSRKQVLSISSIVTYVYIHFLLIFWIQLFSKDQFQPPALYE